LVFCFKNGVDRVRESGLLRRKTMDESFDLRKYMGKWYELLHYPAPFQKPASYNTTAYYKLNEDKTVSVCNESYANGEYSKAEGIARPRGETQFRVDFQPEDVLQNMPNLNEKDGDEPNYIIRKIWLDEEGDYAFALVTNQEQDALWLLSRDKRPSTKDVEKVMAYLTRNYDANKFIMTSHYDDK